jgi:adenine/guanine phosphoribosyltransferase-like PRPP-binding protein
MAQALPRSHTGMTITELRTMIEALGPQRICAGTLGTEDYDTGTARLDDDYDVEIAWSNGATTGADHIDGLMDLIE